MALNQLIVKKDVNVAWNTSARTLADRLRRLWSGHRRPSATSERTEQPYVVNECISEATGSSEEVPTPGTKDLPLVLSPISIEPEEADLRVHRLAGRPAVTAEDPELAVLISENELLAQRDNILIGSILTVASIAAILSAAFTVQIPNLCSNYDTRTIAPDNCLTDNEQWMYLLVPLPVIGLAGILLFLTLNSYLAAQLRNKVEQALREKIDMVLPRESDRREPYDIPLPSSHRLASLLASIRRAPTLRRYWYSNAIALSSIVAVLLGMLAPITARSRGGYVWALLAIYVPVTLVLVAAFARGSRSRQLLIDTTEAERYLSDARSREANEPTTAHWWQPGWWAFDPLTKDPYTGRRPIGYLFLPRALELVLKGTASAGALWFARIASDRDWIGVWRGLIAVLAFEFLAYQARYMFNDAIDLDIDRTGQRAAAKGRAPDLGHGTRAKVRIAALFRLAAYVGVAFLLPSAAREPLLVGGILVLVFMAPYDRFAELSRSRWSYDSGDRSHDGHGRSTFACWLDHIPARAAIIRLFLVAPGYGVRAVVGASIGFGGWPPLATVLAIGLALACLEASNVGLGWALEGAADTSADGLRARERLGRRPHIAWLLRHAGLADDLDRVARFSGEEDRGRMRVLVGSPRVNGPRVWNIWMLSCLAFGAAAGVSMNRRFEAGEWGDVLLAAALAIVPAALMLVPTMGTGVVANLSDWWIVPATSGAVAVVVLMSEGQAFQWRGAIIPIVVALIYLGTRLSCYDEYLGTISNAGRSIAAFVGKVVELLYRGVRYVVGFFIGSDVYR